MPVQVAGNGGTNMEVDGTTWRAQRVVQRPIDHGAAPGHFRVKGHTGALAATLAALAPLAAVRYTGSNLMILTGCRVSVAISGAITAAVQTGLELIKATSWTVSDTGAGSSTPTPVKARTTYGTSGIGDLRIAGTAALTAGTRTLDTSPFAGVAFGTGTAVGTTALVPTEIIDPNSYDHPMIFGQNEGFVLRMSHAGPATGTVVVNMELRWSEVATF